jgi:membrane-associated phospholipid phosphatase
MGVPEWAPDDPADDQRSGSDDPFAAMPDARTFLLRVLIGLAIMIGGLCAVGFLITETEPLSAVRDWDDSISAQLADSRGADAADLARLVTRAGDTLSILALMSAVTIVLAAARKWRAIVFLPTAMFVEITTFLTVNHLVGRERPPVDRIGPLPGTSSYPSGHVAATLVCWGAISLLLAVYGFRRSAVVVAAFGVVITAAMAWARVYAGMHYTTDVIAGFAMGVAALAVAIVATGVQRTERARV